MSESSKSESVPLTPAASRAVDIVASRLRIPREAVIERLLNTMLQNPREFDLAKSRDLLKEVPGMAAAAKDPIEALITLEIVDRITGKRGSSSELDMNKLLAFGMMRELFKPQPPPGPDASTLALLSKGSGSSDWLQVWSQSQQMYQQQQAQHNQFLNTLMLGMFGKNYDQMMKEIGAVREETQKSLETTKESIMSLVQSNPPEDTIESILAAGLKTKIRGWLERKIEEGLFPKEQVIKPSGEVDWNAALDKIYTVGKDFVGVLKTVAEKQPTQIPTEEDVSKIPVRGEVPPPPPPDESSEDVEVEMEVIGAGGKKAAESGEPGSGAGGEPS